MGTELKSWLAAARRGGSVWLPDVREACGGMPDAAPVTARLQRLNGSTLELAIPIPR